MIFLQGALQVGSLLTDEAKMGPEQKQYWQQRMEVRRKLQAAAPMANPYKEGVLANDQPTHNNEQLSEIDKALGLDAIDDLLED